MLLCTYCNQAVALHTSYIAGYVVPDGIRFQWACEHHPAEDADIVLASNDCAARYVEAHPEYNAVFEQLFAAHKC